MNNLQKDDILLWKDKNSYTVCKYLDHTYNFANIDYIMVNHITSNIRSMYKGNIYSITKSECKLANNLIVLLYI